MEKKFIVTKTQLKRLVRKGAISNSINAEAEKFKPYKLEFNIFNDATHYYYVVSASFGKRYLGDNVASAIATAISKKYKPSKVDKMVVLFPLSKTPPQLKGGKFKTPEELEKYVLSL